VTIEKVLDTGLPPKFDKDVYAIKCKSVFDHVYDSYLGEGNSVYGMAS
jgi:type I restriction enzyme R subunit